MQQVRIIVSFTASVSILVGTFVLLGWHSDNEALKSLSTAFVAMNPLSAIGFIFSGLCLFFSLGRNPGTKFCFYFFSALILGIALTKIMSFLGWDLELDTFFFTAKVSAAHIRTANRMAPNTAFGFFLMASSLLLLNKNIWWSQACTILTFLISFLALIGYVYGVTPLTQISYFIPMALNTAMTFVICCFGILSLRYDQGLVGLITSREAGGFLLRRVLPTLVVVPPVFGWLAIRGSDIGLFSGPYGVALVVISGVIMTTSLIFLNARSLNLASLELKNLNQELESFSYSVSHDLRSPLRSIIGFTDVILEEEQNALNPTTKKNFGKIVHAAQRMQQMINGLLDLARVTRGGLQKKSFSLSKAAKNIAQQLRETMPEQETEIIIAENLQVFGDERLLENVLQNLIGNSWKFTSKKAPGKIEVGCHQQNGKTVYYIKDNGAGFDMNYANKLFGVFQRLHTPAEFEGTGIGLATAQRIITRHGGCIWAEGKPNEGASFFFTLN